MNDIEIAQNSVCLDICDIAKKLELDEKDLILYGSNKAKIKKEVNKKRGKLVLVTAINPTPFGEGKTTVSIGLGDALNKLNLNPVIVLREPSMGPVFGIKGGATGGGYSQVIPMEDINLHFTGDFHAITAANDLLCAAIDNHIFQGNDLDIQTVSFNRCLDVNDRALRKIKVNGRDERFCITAASEIMALFCLADSVEDLKRRLGNIIVGYNSKNQAIYAKDLKVDGAMSVLLKDAFLPNLVQTLEHTPTIIHGGPFANIAHGCNSVVATKLALGLGDYVVTEAGFGADLGAEKFLNIKCRKIKDSPDCIVLVATIKAIKYNSSIDTKEAIEKGICNLGRHIENLKKFGVPVVVCLNKYDSDLDSDIDYVVDYCKKYGVDCEVSSAYAEGGNGALNLAKKVVELCDNKKDFKLLYNDNQSIEEKIKSVCFDIYGANEIEYSELALEKLEQIKLLNKQSLPICIAKTQYSLSDDAKKLGSPKDFKVFVRDIHLYNGAEFVTVLLGNIMKMPGLSSKPNFEKIDLIDDKIVGLN